MVDTNQVLAWLREMESLQDALKTAA